MKKTPYIAAAALAIIVICMSGCAPKRKMAAPSPAPPSSASWFAPLESMLLTIAESEDQENVNNSMQEVLDMCLNGEIPVKIFKVTEDDNYLYIITTVREYLEVLSESDFFADRINDVKYDLEGKITSLVISRSFRSYAQSYAEAFQPVTPARYGVLEENFIWIANKDDSEAVIREMEEVLLKCVSPDIPVLVFLPDNDIVPVEEYTIRTYMTHINETGIFDERINEVIHNAYGNISSVSLVRE